MEDQKEAPASCNECKARYVTYVCQQKVYETDPRKAFQNEELVLVVNNSQEFLQENMSKKIHWAILKAGVFVFNCSPITLTDSGDQQGKWENRR